MRRGNTLIPILAIIFALVAIVLVAVVAWPQSKVQSAPANANETTSDTRIRQDVNGEPVNDTPGVTGGADTTEVAPGTYY